MDAMHPWRGIRPWKRHSLVLVVAGLVYVAIGIAYTVGEPSRSRNQSLKLALDWLPLEWWGVIFVLTGLMAIISSRWPPISETWGYTVMSTLSAGWAGFYLMGILFEGAPTGNFSAVALWGLIGFLWWAIGGLRNPDDILLVDDTGEPV